MCTFFNISLFVGFFHVSSQTQLNMYTGSQAGRYKFSATVIPCTIKPKYIYFLIIYQNYIIYESENVNNGIRINLSQSLRNLNIYIVTNLVN